MVAASPDLLLVPGNADFPSRNPAWASDPPLAPQVSVAGGEPACGPFKGAARASVSFHLTQTVRIPYGFYSQSYWKLPSSRLGSPAGGQAPPPLRAASAACSPSGCSSATHTCESSPVCDFAPPASFHVAPSLYHQTYVLRSAGLQVVLHADCFIISMRT